MTPPGGVCVVLSRRRSQQTTVLFAAFVVAWIFSCRGATCLSLTPAPQTHSRPHRSFSQQQLPNVVVKARRGVVVDGLLAAVGGGASLLVAPRSVSGKEYKPVAALDDATVTKYKAVVKAQEKMSADQRTAYVKKLCDIGLFGPSILGALLCR